MRPLEDDGRSTKNQTQKDEPSKVWSYLGDVAGSGEAEGDGPDGLGHEAHGDLVATVPDGLDGLAYVPVAMSHADVLQQEVNVRTAAAAAAARPVSELLSP